MFCCSTAVCKAQQQLHAHIATAQPARRASAGLHARLHVDSATPTTPLIYTHARAHAYTQANANADANANTNDWARSGSRPVRWATVVGGQPIC